MSMASCCTSLAILLLGWGVAAAGAPAKPPEIINYEASSSEIERNKLILHDIDMSQGPMRIKADLAVATGPDKDPVKNSNWVFTGNVHVWMPEGELHADRAEAQISDGRISSTAASGAPASFEEPPQPGREAAHGHARDINYDVASDQVRLTGDAWLTDGCNEFNSDRITYSVSSQQVEADSHPGGTQRIHGTICPQSLPHTPGKRP
jgi:lipopolysaccharide transport protein LptA